MFDQILKGPVDPMYDLKKQADGDTCPTKVDLGVGIYRNEEGLYQELECVQKAKLQLANNNPTHDYEVTTGNAVFLSQAAQVMLGKSCQRLASNEVSSVQTISGTGAVHLAALLLASNVTPTPRVYVGVPAWGNYKPIFGLVGMEVIEYNYYDKLKRAVDFDSILQTVKSAPSASVFILQGCCHNPTGADLTNSQWNELALAMQTGKHVPLFDVAYQGLGKGLDEDAYAVRHFASMGFEMLVCQSFSKNFALYGERCGALHVLSKSSSVAANVFDRLRCLIRWEFSSSPAYGSRLVNIVLDSPQLTDTWKNELVEMQGRLVHLRQRLFHHLTNNLKTPGEWNHIVKETGLFSFLKLNPSQCATLIAEHHIYLPPTGRINVSGLNESNVERVSRAIDAVVRESINSSLPRNDVHETNLSRAQVAA